jgi:hypothetical protein
MTQKQEGNGNGKVSILLWLNTILTALILPILGFMGSKLWSSVDNNASALADLKIEVGIIKDRQIRVLDTIPKLDSKDQTLEQLFEEHLRKWHSNNP